MDIVRRKLVMVTVGTLQRVKTIFYSNSCEYYLHLKRKRVCKQIFVVEKTKNLS